MPARPALRRVLGLGLLLAAVAAPLAPGWTAPLALSLLAAAWLLLRPPRREVVLAGVPILAAVALLALAAGLAPPADPADPAWRAATLERYGRLWRELEREAERAAAVLPDPLAAADRVELFRALADIVPTDETGRGALLLVDADGTPVAWAGEGLLHELTPQAIPRSGPDYRASFAAVTALVVRPLASDGRRPWRVVAARSFATDRLPFAPGAGSGPPLRWSLAGVPDEAAPGAVVLEVDGAPDLVVEAAPAVAESAPDHARRLRRAAGLLLALALFALAVVRGLGIALAGDEGEERWVVAGRGAPEGEASASQAKPLDGGSPAAGGLAEGPATPARGASREGTEAGSQPPPTGAGDPAGRAASPARGGGWPPLGRGAAFEVGLLAVAAALVAAAAAGAAVAVVAVLPVAATLAIAGGLAASGWPAMGRSAGRGAVPAGPPSPSTEGSKATTGGAALKIAADAAGPGRRGGRPRLPRFPHTTLLAGVVSIVLLAALAFLLRRLAGPVDGGPALFGSATGFVARAALASAAAGLLAFAGALGRWRREGAPGGDGWAWGAIAALLAGAAVCDFPAAALPLFATGGAAAARWLAGRTLRRPIDLAVLALVAALAAAGVGETVARALLRVELGARVAARAAPPGAREIAATGEELARAFTGLRLADFVPRSPEGLERQDLAFLLWQASPLAHPHALSALVVRPPEGPASTFGFGLSLADDGAVDWSALAWRELPVGDPAALVIDGAAPLFLDGRPWGRLEWTLVPLPGHRLAPQAAVERIEVSLLRGGPSGRPLPGLPPAVEVALYDAAGRAVSSPWQEAPPLPAPLAAVGGRARVRTPEGWAWAVARRTGGGWSVLYLPILSPLGGLERVGSHALGLVLVALLLVAVALLVALPRAAFRGLLARTVRSYSKRLLLVYTLLLLVPLLLLNTLLVAGVGDRLRREQRAAGEGALSAAQRVLGDYLASLDPGFDLASELDDSLLAWLSGVVRHEVILYWGSEVWASTKPEMFAARLLPKRIPGESYARLALLGYDRASRTNRVGDASYLELYAPLALPGEEAGPRNFFLSMPLLAQQEEVARELDALRRQALLVTAALVVLVTAVGVRLSKSFTRPIHELVEGTRRIAAGAPSLDLAPTELELAALVEAVDDMARRIALGRERLVREKQVVERIVEHITSGVVSLDRERRVLMRNRVAAELLEVEVGDHLPAVVAARPRLAPVAGWLPEVGDELAQRTVRLPAAGGAGGDGDAAGDEAAAGAEEREWTLVWVPVPGAGDPAALLVVEDATETLRGQRLEAWAEMARIIAHEIKNPLTPIRLNVEHMQQVWRDGAARAAAAGGDGGAQASSRFADVFARCTGNVLAQVDELQQIAAEFSTYSRIPKIELQPGDLVALVHDLAAPYRAAPPPGVTVEVEAPPGPLAARFDRRLLSRALRNLVENALRASVGGGRVVLRVERRDGDGAGGGGEARVAVVDSGPGVAPALLPRIFDPYFSTHDTGTGLGLPIARRIAEEHGGGIAARNRAEGGLEVVISLPVG